MEHSVFAAETWALSIADRKRLVASEM